MAALYFTREFTIGEAGALEMYSGRIFGPTLESCMEQVRLDYASGRHSYSNTEIGCFDDTIPIEDRNDTALTASELLDLLRGPPRHHP